MRAVLLSPPESFLAERHRQGIDRWDEVWEGVLHMVPPPSDWHQRFAFKLGVALARVTDARGLEASHETGLFRTPGAEQDYRVPDLIVTSPAVRKKRGVEGAPDVVFELLSPDDESREKLPFYEAVGAREVFLIDPETRQVELYVRRGERLLAVVPEKDGGVRSEVLGLRFVPITGPKLRLELPDGAVEI